MSPLSAPILVIHRETDIERGEWITQAYQDAGIEFSFLNALDGHGSLEALAPFLPFLRDRFWNDSKIKPGAFACFCSHILAWRAIADGSAHWGIIAEDDSAPDAQLTSLDLDARAAGADLLFLNDRASRLASAGDTSVATAIETVLLAGQGAALGFRAPGGDGYALTKQGARNLLGYVDAAGITCGVDWFLFAACWPRAELKHRDVKAQSELKLIWRHIAENETPLKGMIARTPLFTNRDFGASTIVHKTRVEIADFKAAIENAR